MVKVKVFIKLLHWESPDYMWNHQGITKTKESQQTKGENCYTANLKQALTQNVYIHISMKKKIWLGTYGKYKQDISVMFKSSTVHKGQF